MGIFWRYICTSLHYQNRFEIAKELGISILSFICGCVNDRGPQSWSLFKVNSCSAKKIMVSIIGLVAALRYSFYLACCAFIADKISCCFLTLFQENCLETRLKFCDIPCSHALKNLLSYFANFYNKWSQVFLDCRGFLCQLLHERQPARFTV